MQRDTLEPAVYEIGSSVVGRMGKHGKIARTDDDDPQRTAFIDSLCKRIGLARVSDERAAA